MIKKFLKCLKFSFILLILFCLPFFVEWILFNTTIFPFNIPILFPRDTWFGFIASYLGAIGTVLLGVIALYQSKKYKELSDQSEQQFIKLQEDIKTLTEKNVKLIEINTKIEQAKYHPILTHLNYFFWNLSGDSLIKNFSMDLDSFQFTIKKEDTNYSEQTINDIFNNYHTYTYTLKNDGEKTIKNFNCTNITTNNKKYQMGFWHYRSCDIEPGATLRIVYATKFDLNEYTKSGKIETLDFDYSMENVLGEKFIMNTHIDFIDTGEELIATNIEISPVIEDKSPLSI